MGDLFKSLAVNMNKMILSNLTIDEEGPEVRVTLPCGYRARFWLMGLSEEEYIRRTQCMKEIDHSRDNMKIKSGQEAGSDD